MIDPCIVYSSLLVLSDTMIFAGVSLLLDRAACSWRSNPCFYCCCLLMVWWYYLFLLEEEADKRR